MSGWDDDDDHGEEFSGAGNLLQQLQAEQAGQGLATTTMGAFEDENDELGASSESDLSDTEFVDEDTEDIDDEEVRRRFSFRKRFFNRYSKPRYLKKYYVISVLAQINLYAALFSLQGVLGNSSSTIVLIVIAGILLASQIGEGKQHFEYAAEIAAEKEQSPAGPSVAGAARAALLVTDPEVIMKQRKRLAWHGKMIFFPGIVAIFSTLIFLLGLFTVLFAYGVTISDEGQEICASGPMAVWAEMSAEGWVFALWHIGSFAPVLLALTMLSFTHFRSYNDMMTEHVKQAKQEELAAKEAARKKGPQFKQAGGDDDEHDGKDSKENLGFLSGGTYLRHCFLGSLLFQLLSYAVLFVARNNTRPATEGVCIDADQVDFDCALRASQGYCYSEQPGGDPEITRETVAHCCLSCSGGPLESGGGMLYGISVFGMAFWGYQLGFVKSYLSRGKDALGFKKQESLHEANIKLTWHASGLFYPSAKAIMTTVIYFASVLSLLYYYTENNGTCPRSPLQAITRLSGDGFLMWLLVTVFYAPVMTAELLLLSIHFDLWKRYQKIVARSGRMTWK